MVGPWKHLVQVTKFGANEDFCNLSPWNLPNDALDRYRSSKKTVSGTNSCDLVYHVA